ncbi:serine/threonine protein kinase [Glycomyces sp. NRRL B-16210]|uniref:serine/threonine protein kinase n=1 Tax=Glycomyces sp. NRRL B-16210 TaxID=1463821 RepID=UPI00069099CA|nr:serine/threonine protein kinase [Glycomyces sp. NRRL B-16210]
MDSGTLIAGRYRLEQVVASGGMGSVWRARDERLDREVAVKVMHPGLSGEELQPHERFEREAKTLASLKGPGCVEVYDFGEHLDGDRRALYLVMELVEGVSLAELLRREGPLDPARTMRIVAETAEALEAAHRRGIVHRDVKPGNVLIDADDRVRVIDFGISLFADRTRITPGDSVLGTVTYVSPEQLRAKEVTGSSDLYSLGAVAYECLTGAPPFEAADPAAVIHGHLYAEPPALPEAVPQEVAQVVAKLLQKAPDERWPSGRALAAACRAAAGEGAPVWLHRTVDLERQDGEAGVAAAGVGPGEASGSGSAASESSAGTAVAGVPDSAAGAEPPDERSTLAEAASEPRRRRRVLLMLLPVLVVVVVSVPFMVTLTPWNSWIADAGPGDVDTSSTVSHGDTGEVEADDAESDSASASATPSEGETPTGTADSTAEGPGETGGGGGSTGPAPDADEPEDEAEQSQAPVQGSGEVPNVTGMTTFEARDALNAQGFTNVVAQVGYYAMFPEPEHCEVMQHSPGRGQTIDHGDRITLSYHSRNAVGTTCEW